MVFASPLFLFLFLPLALTGYFLIRPRFRNVYLFLLSLFFYGWAEPNFVLLMIASILLNYAAGAFLNRQRQKSVKRLTAPKILLLCLSGNLGLLFYFKYANFFLDQFNLLLQQLSINPLHYAQISLPIGISFFTFQAMSYVMDVYRKEVDVSLNPIHFGLYISLFPKLLAGPIVRYHDLAKQIQFRTVPRLLFSAGIQRFVFGLAKKTMLADPLGEVADQIFAVPMQDVTAGMAWLGIGCYTLQIYFDFSGYSDMAIGLGRLLGFEFLENFNYPYIARSLRDFWRRWHISLSIWFREYLYIPLGGNRGSSWRTVLNLWTVFLLCGFWHGASWNFVIWGVWHGFFLSLERIIGWPAVFDRVWPPIRHFYTLFLVMIGWVFFRSESLSLAIQYLAALIGLTHADGVRYYAFFYCDLKTILTFIIGAILATPLAKSVGKLLESKTSYSRLRSLQLLLYAGRYALVFSLFILSAAKLAAGTYHPFIYFRF